MSRFYSLEAVQRRLGDFGEGLEIAAQFAILGIRGEPNDPDSCPIAVLVHGACRVEYDEDVKITAQEIAYGSHGIAMPAAGRAFVRMFDDYAWPELIEER